MIEERVNMERPTSSEVHADQAGAESVLASASEASGEPGARATHVAAGKRTVVAVRLSDDALAALDEVREQLGGSRSDALRASVEAVHEALASGRVDRLDKTLAKSVAARRPVVRGADEALIAEQNEASREVAERYSDAAFQLQKIGNNWNQLVKLAHVGERVDADAMDHVARALERLARALEESR